MASLPEASPSRLGAEIEARNQSVVRGAERPRMPPRLQALLAAAAAIPLVLWAIVAFESRGRTLDEATEDARRIAVTVGEQTTKLLEIQALVLDLVDRMAGDRDCAALRADPDAQPFMAAVVRRAAQTETAWVLDVNGFMCVASDPAKLDGRSRSFREYFSGARDAGPGSYYVNRAIVGLIGGIPAFNMARRRGDGPAFSGIVLVAVDLRDLIQYWQETLAVAPTRRVALLRMDGAVVARSWTPLVPPPDPETERRAARMWRDAAEGSQIGPSTFDGTQRLHAWRVLPRWGLVVTTSIAEDEALRPWRRTVLLYGLVAVPAAVMLAGLAWSLWGAHRRLELANSSLELQVAARTAALQQSETELREANRAKDGFLAMLGHELRNPLGAIASAVSVLDVAGGQPAGERARAVIGRQVEHLSRLVDDLLDVSRLTTGKVRLDRRPLDLGELVGRTLTAWRSAGRFRQHDVAVDVVSVWVDGDATRIEQVLANLVGNALKYTPGGGRVSIRVGQDRQDAVLEIGDSGAGIPPNLMGKIFDLFVQGDRALDRAPGGLGIGLTLVKALVRMHGGTVEARSEGDGKGSVFTVRLPSIPAPVHPAEVATSCASTGPGRRILLVEDNEDAREMMRVALTVTGHEVHEAADGPSGIAAALALVPDVALIDVGLPGLDGYEVVRRIRKSEVGTSIRLVAITGYGQVEDRQRALEAGFDAHLTKPVTPERLAEALVASRAERRSTEAV